MRLKQQRPPNQPLSRRHARRRRRLRRIAAFGGLLMLVAVIVAGVQGWRIVNALVEAERAVVVPLPTRGAGVELGGVINSGAVIPVLTPADLVTPSSETPSPTAVDNNDPTPTVDPALLTPRASAPAMPNVTVVPTSPADIAAVETPTAGANAATSGSPPTPQPAGSSNPNPTATPLPTATPEATATPAPTESPPEVASSDTTPTVAAESGAGGSSRFDVLQQVLGAGLETGDPATSEVWNGQTELTILVIGVDRRGDGSDQNSDVIIIARLDLINRELRAVSIPRDLLVEVPGIGYDKINSAYRYGVEADPENPAAGVAKLRDTIEYNFGIPIDHYVMVDFDGFVAVVDAVGGIEVDVPYDILDEAYPTADYGVETVFFPAGPMEMDGETALKYVRTRHADSDDHRRERQMQVILAIFERGKSAGGISRIDDMIVALADSAQTSFQLDQQLTLARLALELEAPNITTTSLAPPLLTGGYIETGAWVYTGDMAAIIAFVQEAVYGP